MLESKVIKSATCEKFTLILVEDFEEYFVNLMERQLTCHFERIWKNYYEVEIQVEKYILIMKVLVYHYSVSLLRDY